MTEKDICVTMVTYFSWGVISYSDKICMQNQLNVCSIVHSKNGHVDECLVGDDKFCTLRKYDQTFSLTVIIE